jgi:hypothetical protein
MFYLIFKDTLKAIRRNMATRTFLIILLAIAILEVCSFYFGTFLSNNTNSYYSKLGYYKYIFGVVSAFAGYISFVIILICSFDISYNTFDSFMDIQKTTKINIATYYLSKLTAYFTVFYVSTIVTVILEVTTSLLSPNCKMTINMSDFISRILLNMIVIAIPCILTYIGISVFFTIATKKRTVGMICGLLYLFSPNIVGYYGKSNTNFIFDFIHWMPSKLFNYMYNFNCVYTNAFINNEMFKTSFNEAVLSLIICLVISAVLLISGYMILLKRED